MCIRDRSYIINYISKVEAGLSRLLKEAASDVKNEKMNTRGRLSKVANVFLNSNLMCAQEAAQKKNSLKKQFVQKRI